MKKNKIKTLIFNILLIILLLFNKPFNYILKNINKWILYINKMKNGLRKKNYEIDNHIITDNGVIEIKYNDKNEIFYLRINKNETEIDKETFIKLNEVLTKLNKTIII